MSGWRLVKAQVLRDFCQVHPVARPSTAGHDFALFAAACES
jgi:hypothetical protein